MPHEPATPECPLTCPNRHQSSEVARLHRVGLGIASVSLMLFVGAWVARGYFERKTPSVFEIGFALSCVYLGLSDPKTAQKLSGEAIGKLLGSSNSSSQEQ